MCRSSAHDDKSILQKGSKFANRVFLSNMKERDSAPHTFFYPSQMFHLIGITTMKAHIGVQNEGKYIQIDYCFTKIQKSDQVSIIVPHSIIMIYGANRCRTSTLIMVPFNFWQNSDPFKKKTFF